MSLRVDIGPCAYVKALHGLPAPPVQEAIGGHLGRLAHPWEKNCIGPLQSSLFSPTLLSSGAVNNCLVIPLTRRIGASTLDWPIVGIEWERVNEAPPYRFLTNASRGAPQRQEFCPLPSLFRTPPLYFPAGELWSLPLSW